MGRGGARADGDHPTDRVDGLDGETLRLAASFVVGRSVHQATDSRCVVAWDRFYRACDPLFHKLASRRCGRSWSAEDRVQELWRAIIERIGGYDPERGAFPGWLATVVRKALTDQDRASHVTGHLDEGVERGLPSREADPSEAFEQVELRELIEAAVEAIRPDVPEKSYIILRRHWVEGRSYEEIGAALGLEPKQVRDRQQRVMGTLRSILLRRSSR